MKKASVFLKQIMSLLTIKSKTSALKTRAIMFSLMRSKKVLVGSISNKIHSILGQPDRERKDDDDDDDDDGDQSKAIVLYSNVMASESLSGCSQIADRDDDRANNHHYYDDDDKLTHSLSEEENFDDPGGSVIDLVRNSKEDGKDFSLEDEIDHVADLFIMRFHKQMRLQKLESFKRRREALESNV